MRFNSRAAIAAIVFSVMFDIGCGDTFRPIAIPIIQPGGQPQSTREAVILSTGGAAAGSPDGQTTHINVSGDTNAGQVGVGRDPIQLAILPNTGLTVVVNRAEDSISIYPTLSPLAAEPPTFVSLVSGSVPVFAYSNVSGVVYVAESGPRADPSCAVSPCGHVAVVSTSGNPTAVTAEVAVGSNPVGLVGTADATRLYVANKGSNSVSVIDTGTNTLAAPDITVGAAPVFLAVNTNGTRVFAVNNGGTVSVIDTSTNTVIASPAVGAAPNFAYFDGVNNKLWVTNPGNNSVSVISVDPNSPPPSAATPIALPAGCTPNPISNFLSPTITVLADGSRAYVAGTGCNSVIVINALSNTVTKTIPVGTAPVAVISSPDSTKIYTANNGSGNMSIIQTSNDTVVSTLAAPAGTSPIYAAISPF